MNAMQKSGSLKVALSLLLASPSLIMSTMVRAQEAALQANNSSNPSAAIATVEASNAGVENLGTVADLQDLVPLSITDFTVVADAVPADSQAQADPEATERDPLEVPPRFGAGYTGHGGSFGGLGRFEGFVPIFQEPGEEIGFLEGRLIFGDNTDIGLGLLFDYRGYNEDANRIRGGYVGFDVRDTSDNTFYQLGTGYESLGDEWDFRFNAYLPIGDRSQESRDFTNTTFSDVSSEFQENKFVLNSTSQVERIQESEVALGGFDAEAGYRIAEWNEGEGDLTGFAGLYLYGSPETPTYLGWQMRVFSNFTPNFNGGLAVRDDGLFGTHVVFSVGATFPGNRPEGPVSEEDYVRARLGEFVVRQPEMAIFLDRDSEITTEVNSDNLQNPEEDQDYHFQHVDLASGDNGDGTFESPFNNVQDALDATVSDGNDIVYIDGEGAEASVIPAFEIPERVQVLSQGPTQTIAGLPFPGFDEASTRLPFSTEINFEEGIVVELPFSGDGVFPSVENVTVGERTVLAGFQINNAAGDAIQGTNINNVELRNNTITGSGDRGIDFLNVGGSVVIFDHIIRDSTGQAIYVENTTTESALQLSIFGYEIANSSVGMEFITTSTGGITGTPSQSVAIAPGDATLNTSSGTFEGFVPTNIISNSTSEGLIVESTGSALTNSASQIVTFSNGTITGSGEEGVLVRADTGAGSQEFSLLDGSVVSNSGNAGIRIINGDNNPTDTAYGQEIFIRDSQISDNDGSGIDIGLNARGGAQEINVTGNTITGNTGDGITSLVQNNGLQEFPFEADGQDGIVGNTISGNGGQSINIDVEDTATLAVLNVRDNDLGGALDVSANEVTTQACVQVTGNTVPSGISLTSTSLGGSQALFQVLNIANLSAANSGAPSTFTPDESVFTNLDPGSFCLQD